MFTIDTENESSIPYSHTKQTKSITILDIIDEIIPIKFIK